MSKRIQSVLEDADFDYLDRYATKEGFSISTLIRWIVLNWISKQKEDDKRKREQVRREANIEKD